MPISEKRYQQKNPTYCFCTGPGHRPRTIKSCFLLHQGVSIRVCRYPFPVSRLDLSCVPCVLQVHTYSWWEVKVDRVDRQYKVFNHFISRRAPVHDTTCEKGKRKFKLIQFPGVGKIMMLIKRIDHVRDFFILIKCLDLPLDTLQNFGTNDLVLHRGLTPTPYPLL